MSDLALKKDEVKKNLRSLLLSAPAALTIDELKRDYHDFINEPIPFRKLGYINLEDLLKDMPDALHVTWKKGVMCVSGIADNTTAHIQKLVSKQKVTNKQKWATLRKGGPPPQRHRSNQPPRPLPTVPPFLRKYLRQLFDSYPDGLPFTHFDTAFSRRFNFPINPVKSGFSSMLELLKSVPDILEVRELRDGEIRVCPMKSRKSNHEGAIQDHPFYQSYHKSSASSNLPPRFQRQHSEPNTYENYQRQNSIETWPFTPASSTKTNVMQSGQQISEQTPVGRGKKKTCLLSPEERTPRRRYNSDNSSGSFTSSVSSTDYDSGIGSQHLYEIQQILCTRPEGMWATKLLSVYKETYNKELKPMDHGYTSVIELCSALPSIIRIERPNSKGDWMLFDKRLPSPPKAPRQAKRAKKETEPVRQRHTSQKCADETLKETIRQVLQAHPDGVKLHLLPQVFQEATGKPLEWEKLGFARMDSFALSLADTVLQFEYRGNNSILLFPIENDSPRRTDLLKHQPSVKPVEDTACVTEDRIPSDAVGPGTSYHNVTLPKCNDWIEIYVTYVKSPGLFWFQLRGSRTSTALEKLMDQLEIAYSGEEGDAYCMPSDMVAVGIIIAVKYPGDENWHRGVITGMHPGLYVEVYFVDYGDTCKVHRDNIRFLKSKFLKLPAQAIQGRLANIEPVGEQWSRESTSRLLNLVTSRPLIAIATSEKNQIMSLCVADTTGKDDIHINDLLISDGYAVFHADGEETHYADSVDVQAINYALTGGSETGSTFSESAYGDVNSSQHYVLQVKLADSVVVHLINLNGTAYLLSSEVSSFFWEDDFLTSMLIQRKATARKIKVSVEEQPALFNELHQYGLKGVKPLTLYELNGVPDIMDLFQMESGDLRQDILQLMESFDPEDAYWKGEEFELPEYEIERLEMKDIEEALQICQFKRKRILQNMMYSSDNTADSVNDLNEVEVKIKKLNQLIESKRDTTDEENITEKQSSEQTTEDPEAMAVKMSEQSANLASEARSLPVSPQKITFSSNSNTKPVATVASMPQPKQKSPTVQASETQPIPTLDQNNLLQQIAQQQQQLNMFQAILLNQLTNPASNPAQSGLNLQVPQLGSVMNAAGAAGLAPNMAMHGLGRGMSTLAPPPVNNINPPISNYLLPGLLPLLETLNLNKDGAYISSQQSGTDCPPSNTQQNNPNPE